VRTRLAFAVALQLMVLSGPAMNQTASPTQKAPVLTFVGSIPLANVDGRMDHMSVDLVGRRLFSAAFDNHTLDRHRNFETLGPTGLELATSCVTGRRSSGFAAQPPY